LKQLPALSQLTTDIPNNRQLKQKQRLQEQQGYQQTREGKKLSQSLGQSHYYHCRGKRSACQGENGKFPMINDQFSMTSRLSALEIEN
jgi:hypothetical protein